jgi:hypothetical protein
MLSILYFFIVKVLEKTQSHPLMRWLFPLGRERSRGYALFLFAFNLDTVYGERNHRYTTSIVSGGVLVESSAIASLSR